MHKQKQLAYLLLHRANLFFQSPPLQSHSVVLFTGTTMNKFTTGRGRQQKSFWAAVLQESTTLDQALSRQMYRNTTIFTSSLPFVSMAIFPVTSNERTCPKHPLKLHHCLMWQTSNLRMVLHRKDSKNIHQEPEHLPRFYKKSIRMEFTAQKVELVEMVRKEEMEGASGGQTSLLF